MVLFVCFELTQKEKLKKNVCLGGKLERRVSK